MLFWSLCSTDSIYDHCRLKMPRPPLNRAKCTRSSHSPSYCLHGSFIKAPYAPRSITRTRPPLPLQCFSASLELRALQNNITLPQQPPVPAKHCCLLHSLFLSVRFQDQVGEASVGPNNLTPLFSMLDGVANIPLEHALLGDGSTGTG